MPHVLPHPHLPMRLLALDLDGTLLRTDKNITQHTARALHAAQHAGVCIVLATARPPRSVAAIAQALHINSWQINYNGALIHDPVRHRNIMHLPLPLDLAQHIIQVARRADPQVVVSIEILDKWYTDHFDPTLPTETSKNFMPDCVGPLNAILRTPVTKLMFLAPPDRLDILHQTISQKFSQQVALAVSDRHLLQVLHPQADKAHALERIATHYKIPRAQVMAIGDAPNDLGMLRWAGLGIAMANAWTSVHAAIKNVVPSNDDDGVAHAIHHYILHDTSASAPDTPLPGDRYGFPQPPITKPTK